MLESPPVCRPGSASMFMSLLFFAALTAPSAGEAHLFKPGFGRAALWNDGQAEVSVYEATDVKEGHPRTSHPVLIVVAEDLLPDRLVKADHPSGAKTIRVLKLNHVRSIPVGMSMYQQMLSVFAGADRLEPVKVSMTSNDGCGNSFVEWRSDRRILSVRSYWETPGDVDASFAPGDAIFYDSLPMELRALDFDTARTGRLRIVDSVFSSRPGVPAVQEA